MDRPMHEMTPLGRLIREGLQRYHLEQGVTAQNSVSLWERVVGEPVASATRADGIKDGILFVYTRSSAWSQELSLMREDLMGRINTALGGEVVKDIRFQVRRFRKADAPEPAAPPRRALTPEEAGAIESVTGSLEAPVAGRLARVMTSYAARADRDRRCKACGARVRPGEDTCPFCR
jgi:hypothetical protein